MTPSAKARISPRLMAIVVIAMGLLSMALGYVLHPM